MANGDKPRRHAAAYNNRINAWQYEQAIRNHAVEVANDRTITDLRNQNNYDQWAFQQEVRNFEIEEQLRVYNKAMEIYGLNQSAIDQEVQFQTDQIYSTADARLQEPYYEQQDLEFDFAREQIESNFALADNILQTKNVEMAHAMKINQDRQRDRQFATDMAQQTDQMTDAKASARVELLKNTLQTNAEKGTASASGRRGQSANALNQSIEAVAAIDQYSLISDLERGDASFKKVTGNVVYQKSEQDKISAKEKRSLRNNKKQLQNNKKKLQTLFGLTVQEFEADTEKLGRMMVDTYAGIDSQLARLAQQEFQSRVDLYAKSPLPPRIGPRAKPPREIPYTQFAEPRVPPFMPYKAAGSTAPKQKGPSGLSIAAVIGGGILTAAAPFAAPALAAGGGFFGTLGVAGTSSALAGVGGLFSNAGRSGLF